MIRNRSTLVYVSKILIFSQEILSQKLLKRFKLFLLFKEPIRFYWLQRKQSNMVAQFFVVKKAIVKSFSETENLTNQYLTLILRKPNLSYFLRNFIRNEYNVIIVLKILYLQNYLLYFRSFILKYSILLRLLLIHQDGIS